MTINIERDLVNHPPSKGTQVTMELVRHRAHELADALNRYLPGCRESSLAATNLEQSLMWAMAALARADYDTTVKLSGATSDRLADAGLD